MYGGIGEKTASTDSSMHGSTYQLHPTAFGRGESWAYWNISVNRNHKNVKILTAYLEQWPKMTIYHLSQLPASTISFQNSVKQWTYHTFNRIVGIVKPSPWHLTNYNAISLLISFPSFEVRIWSVDQTENRDSLTPGFVCLDVILEIKNAVFMALISGC